MYGKTINQTFNFRPWKLSDAENLYEYAKSNLFGTNAGWPSHESIEGSIMTLKQFIASDCVYAIELKGRNKVIGGIGIHKRQLDDQLKNLKQRENGYVLNPSYWGNGYT